jgi:hypothetical protein
MHVRRSLKMAGDRWQASRREVPGGTLPPPVVWMTTAAMFEALHFRSDGVDWIFRRPPRHVLQRLRYFRVSHDQKQAITQAALAVGAVDRKAIQNGWRRPRAIVIAYSVLAAGSALCMIAAGTGTVPAHISIGAFTVAAILTVVERGLRARHHRLAAVLAGCRLITSAVEGRTAAALFEPSVTQHSVKIAALSCAVMTGTAVALLHGFSQRAIDLSYGHFAGGVVALIGPASMLIASTAAAVLAYVHFRRMVDRLKFWRRCNRPRRSISGVALWRYGSDPTRRVS